MTVNGTNYSTRFSIGALSVVARVNQPGFLVGQMLRTTVGVTNPGLSGAADFYVGVLRPDGTVEFFIDTGSIVGNISDPMSFQPIAAGVPLATPFSVTVPDFYSYEWIGSETHGTRVFFVAALKAGTLADGVVTNDEILGLATATFAFP